MMATRRRADGRGGSGSRHRPRARAKSVHLEHEAKALLRRSGIATPVGRLVTSAEQASAVAERAWRAGRDEGRLSGLINIVSWMACCIFTRH